jgi:hypothetical protein
MIKRGDKAGKFLNLDHLTTSGLTEAQLRASIVELNELLDSVDQALIVHGVERLSQIVELANLSSMLGNIFAAAVAKNSNGVFQRNGPHKYPDLLSNSSAVTDIEVKIALETNKPKGHLIKTGRYLTCRYVLCDQSGTPMFEKANRGSIPWIWEVRCGILDDHHFSVSNTAGDSGKTAVVNAQGMEALKIVYLDTERLPYSERSKIRAQLIGLTKTS